MKNNIPTVYSPFHKFLHWGMAALMLGMLALGWYIEDIAKPPFKYDLLFWHKSVGILILMLVLVRSLNRFFNPQPTVLEGPVWQRFAANAAHLALYVLMIAMPISGWMMSSAGGHPVSFFGLFTVPPVVMVPNEAVGKLAYEAHGLIGNLLWAVIGLHVAAALYHHFVQKDGTLKRMLP